jgi:hypothetical protein
VRTKPAQDEELLEPLAVDDDGVLVEPVFAAIEEQHAEPKVLAREYAAAFRAVLRERSELRAQPPWNPAPVPAPKTRPSTFQSTFSRMIGLPPARLTGLHDWWCDRANDGRVRVTRRLSLEEPRPANGGTWRTPGRLRSPWGLRSIPVELLLWPYLGGWTKVMLEPQRPVHVGRRYFKRGHRVLDTLTARLVGELEPVT